MSTKKPVLGVVLFCLACLVALMLVIPLFLPGTVIDVVDGEAQVHIETDRTWVAFPWNCYTVSWAVFHTVSVYFDDGGVVGEYSRPECIEWRNAPSFSRTHVYTINKTDGTSRDFPFTQYVLVGRGEFWFGLLLIGVFMVAADLLGGTPWRWAWMRRLLLKLPNARVSLLPEKITTRRQKMLITGALITIFATGMLIRLNHIYLLGQNDYQAWSYNNYYGGLTLAYVTLSGITGGEIPAQYNNIYPLGYPSMISVLHTFGFDYTAMRITQAILDTLAIVPLFLILRHGRISIWASLLGALLYAISPIFVVGSILMLGEWIGPSLMIWVIYLLLIAANSKKWWYWLITGLLLGLLSMFRPEALLIVGVAGLWLLWQRWGLRRTFFAALALGVGFFFFAGLSGLNNLRNTGHFSLTSNAGGYGLWSGLGALPNDYGYFVSDFRARDLLATMGMTQMSTESNQYWVGEYIKAWRERPLYVVSTIASRWFKIWTQQDIGVAGLTPGTPYDLWRIIVVKLQQFGFAVIVAAFVVSYNREKRLFALLFPMLAAMFTIGLVYYETRYVRYTSVTYLISVIILAEWLMNNIRQAIHYRYPRLPQRKLSAALSALVVLTAICFIIPQFASWMTQISINQRTETARTAFTTENRTPDYDMSTLSWYTPGNNVLLEPEGWLLQPNLSVGFATLQTTIPLQGEQTVSVSLDIDLVYGSAYITLLDNLERDQILLQTLGRQTVHLSSYTADLQSLTIRIVAFSYLPDTLLRVESVDVYTQP